MFFSLGLGENLDLPPKGHYIFTAIGGSLGLFLGFSFLDAFTVALKFIFDKFKMKNKK